MSYPVQAPTREQVHTLAEKTVSVPVQGNIHGSSTLPQQYSGWVSKQPSTTRSRTTKALGILVGSQITGAMTARTRTTDEILSRQILSRAKIRSTLRSLITTSTIITRSRRRHR